MQNGKKLSCLQKAYVLPLEILQKKEKVKKNLHKQFAS